MKEEYKKSEVIISLIDLPFFKFFKLTIYIVTLFLVYNIINYIIQCRKNKNYQYSQIFSKIFSEIAEFFVGIKEYFFLKEKERDSTYYQKLLYWIDDAELSAESPLERITFLSLKSVIILGYNLSYALIVFLTYPLLLLNQYIKIVNIPFGTAYFYRVYSNSFLTDRFFESLIICTWILGIYKAKDDINIPYISFLISILDNILNALNALRLAIINTPYNNPVPTTTITNYNTAFAASSFTDPNEDKFIRVAVYGLITIFILERYITSIKNESPSSHFQIRKYWIFTRNNSTCRREDNFVRSIFYITMMDLGLRWCGLVLLFQIITISPRILKLIKLNLIMPIGFWSIIVNPAYQIPLLILENINLVNITLGIGCGTIIYSISIFINSTKSHFLIYHFLEIFKISKIGTFIGWASLRFCEIVYNQSAMYNKTSFNGNNFIIITIVTLLLVTLCFMYNQQGNQVNLINDITVPLISISFSIWVFNLIGLLVYNLKSGYPARPLLLMVPYMIGGEFILEKLIHLGINYCTPIPPIPANDQVLPANSVDLSKELDMSQNKCVMSLYPNTQLPADQYMSQECTLLLSWALAEHYVNTNYSKVRSINDKCKSKQNSKRALKAVQSVNLLHYYKFTDNLFSVGSNFKRITNQNFLRRVNLVDELIADLNSLIGKNTIEVNLEPESYFKNVEVTKEGVLVEGYIFVKKRFESLINISPYRSISDTGNSYPRFKNKYFFMFLEYEFVSKLISQLEKSYDYNLYHSTQQKMGKVAHLAELENKINYGIYMHNLWIFKRYHEVTSIHRLIPTDEPVGARDYTPLLFRGIGIPPQCNLVLEQKITPEIEHKIQSGIKRFTNPKPLFYHNSKEDIILEFTNKIDPYTSFGFLILEFFKLYSVFFKFSSILAIINPSFYLINSSNTGAYTKIKNYFKQLFTQPIFSKLFTIPIFSVLVIIAVIESKYKYFIYYSLIFKSYGLSFIKRTYNHVLNHLVKVISLMIILIFYYIVYPKLLKIKSNIFFKDNSDYIRRVINDAKTRFNNSNRN